MTYTRKLNLTILVVTLIIAITTIFLTHRHHIKQPPYLIGAGIYDITGPTTAIGMMGYGREDQKDTGILSRLYARAFVIADPKTSKSVVFVSADLGMVFHSIKMGVIKQLHKRYGNEYTAKNVMISATHSHSGPGGYSYRAFFNITTLGFDKQNYNAIVNGITQAIVRANNNLQPANITIARGQLLHANSNRSIAAYLKDPKSERARYPYNVDKTMTLIKFTNKNNKSIGTINWFPVHGVSMSNKNTLVNDDNKGYAAYLMENHFHSDHHSAKAFVASFAQANEGDVTPNIHHQKPDGACDNFECGDLKRNETIGLRQYKKAMQLFQSATTPITGSIDYRHQFIEMSQHGACKPAIGYSFAAGTTDGAGASFFHQGELKGNVFINALRDIIATPSRALIHCQNPKPILVDVADTKPYPWVALRMPVQIFKIGQLAIVAVPGEFTTMSGRRLRNAILRVMKPEVKYVVIAGLSNSYAGYIATPQEYTQQNYEGGFTVFGKNTLPTYIKAFKKLAHAIIDHKNIADGPQPIDLSQHQLSFITPVLFDSTPPGDSFGDVSTDANSSYHNNDVVHVTFWAADPRNNLRTQGSFLHVQRLENKHWVTIANDWDWNTLFQWHRVGLSYSRIMIAWKIPANATPGTYRIEILGDYKKPFNKKIYSYHGYSRTFTVK